MCGAAEFGISRTHLACACDSQVILGMTAGRSHRDKLVIYYVLQCYPIPFSPSSPLLLLQIATSTWCSQSLLENSWTLPASSRTCLFERWAASCPTLFPRYVGPQYRAPDMSSRDFCVARHPRPHRKGRNCDRRKVYSRLSVIIHASDCGTALA